MMKLALLFFVLTLTAHAGPPPTIDEENPRFETLAKKFTEEYLQMNPEASTILGEHKYDDRLSDYSQSGVQRERAFAKTYLTQLKQVLF